MSDDGADGWRRRCEKNKGVMCILQAVQLLQTLLAHYFIDTLAGNAIFIINVIHINYNDIL